MLNKVKTKQFHGQAEKVFKSGHIKKNILCIQDIHYTYLLKISLENIMMKRCCKTYRTLACSVIPLIPYSRTVR